MQFIVARFLSHWLLNLVRAGIDDFQVPLSAVRSRHLYGYRPRRLVRSSVNFGILARTRWFHRRLPVSEC